MKVERIFELLDGDHSGFLDSTEFVTGMSELSDVMKVCHQCGSSYSEYLISSPEKT